MVAAVKQAAGDRTEKLLGTSSAPILAALSSMVQDGSVHLPLPEYGHERTRLDR